MIFFLTVIGWLLIFSLRRGEVFASVLSFKKPLLRILLILLIFCAGSLWIIFIGLKAFMLVLLYALPAVLVCSIIQNIYFYFQKKP